MAKPPGPRTAGRARWRVQTISAGNFWRKAEFTSAAQVQSIRGSPRRAKPCGGVILHSLAPQLRLRKIPDFQRLFIILLNIEVCKLIFWGAVLRTLRVVGALTRPRGAAPRRAPTRRGPPFLPRNGGKEGQRGEFLPSGLPALVWRTLRGSSLFSAWPAALYLTPVTARPPAGRAGRVVSRTGRVLPTPKAFPSGGRWAGEAGSDEGAIDWPNGAEEGEHRGDRLIFLQGKVGYRIAPSSVTFGDSFPPRGSLWVVLPYTKKALQIRARTWAPY